MDSSAVLPRLLTVGDVAARWGCKRQRVAALIRAGQLRAVQIGGGPCKARFRIRPEDLDAFELAREVQPPARRGRRPKTQRPPGWVDYFR